MKFTKRRIATDRLTDGTYLENDASAGRCHMEYAKKYLHVDIEGWEKVD
ncbi:MAG: hypothetical protein JW936_04305 [Sedimentisphaerales bacterium]|nr:hypothetical protein [Sedimentisphaerales bacterium]